MTTTLWSDTVDTIDDVWSETVGNNDPTPVYPAAYNSCIMTECPACGAPALMTAPRLKLEDVVVVRHGTSLCPEAPNSGPGTAGLIGYPGWMTVRAVVKQLRITRP
jgi:hypothetical protein